MTSGTNRMTPSRRGTFLFIAAAVCTVPVHAQELLWTRQFGTTKIDAGLGVAVDSAGNVYITGWTEGSLFGPSAGRHDAFLAKYDSSGTRLWTRQIGTSNSDFSRAIAVDGEGNAYITGSNAGGFGGPGFGGNDVFLAKYDASGTPLWARQIGTSEKDDGVGVAVDGVGSAYITGYTSGSLGGTSAGHADAFLAKYDASGTLLWTRQLGTSDTDRGHAVAVDGTGNVYITGLTWGRLVWPTFGIVDVFLAKYDTSGTLLWTRQTGSPVTDEPYGLAVDNAGNAYITGDTLGSFGGPNAGLTDIFLVKYDTSGTLLWTRQASTREWDAGRGVAVDRAGNAYITGLTHGNLGGPNANLTGDTSDFFLAKYDTSGTLLWTQQAGTFWDDPGLGVVLDGVGNAYITGTTKGPLGGSNAGDWDAFLVKYGNVSCYADCDGSGVLDFFDFLCFQNSFVLGEPYACECDPDPACDIFDFLCFQNAFVGGCP